MQVPSEPQQNSHPNMLAPARGGVMSIQLPWVQVASNVTVSPAQPLHVHVVVVDGSPAGPSLPTIVHTHGGHSFVAAQQPLLPGLEPSAHVAAEAQAAAKTSTRNAVRLRAIDDLLSWIIAHEYRARRANETQPHPLEPYRVKGPNFSALRAGTLQIMQKGPNDFPALYVRSYSIVSARGARQRPETG